VGELCQSKAEVGNGKGKAMVEERMTRKKMGMSQFSKQTTIDSK
jgi:hypothetical protein